MPGKELAPLPDVMHQLPAPADFGKLLRERLEGEIVRVRQERGDVTAPADVNQLVRGLQGAREVFGDYMRAFKGADSRSTASPASISTDGRARRLRCARPLFASPSGLWRTSAGSTSSGSRPC